MLPRRKEWWQEFSCQFQPQRIQNNILTFEIIGAVTVPDADWHIDGQWVLAITQCFLLLWKLVGVFLVWRKSVIGEEMETTQWWIHWPRCWRSRAAPPPACRTYPGSSITWSTAGSPTNQHRPGSQAPAWLCAWIYKKVRSHTCLYFLGSTSLTSRRRGGLLLRLKSVVSHPCSPESEGSLWACWYSISFPTTQQLLQSSLVRGLKFGSKLFAPHTLFLFWKSILSSKGLIKNHEISWTTEKFNSS